MRQLDMLRFCIRRKAITQLLEPQVPAADDTGKPAFPSSSLLGFTEAGLFARGTWPASEDMSSAAECRHIDPEAPNNYG
jgi:hypothetical protein